MLSILSLNVNDFGGINNHLMEYKKLKRNGDKVTDWETWSESVDKNSSYIAILRYIRKVNPSILILQEFEVNNSDEPKKFAKQLSEDGYKMISEIPEFKASITAVFVKSEYEYERMNNPNTLNLRSCAFRVGDIIIYGTHVPPRDKPRGESRIQKFWNEIETFYKEFGDEKMLLIGDFNIINEENRKRYESLLHTGCVDVWLEKGYAESTPTCGNMRIDIATASPKLLPFVTDITICPSLLYKGITDHAALIVDI